MANRNIQAKPAPWYPGLDRSNPLSSDLLMAYPFWNSGSLLQDVSGNNYHASWQSDSTNNPDWRGSPYGLAHFFVGGATNDRFLFDENRDLHDSSELTMLIVSRNLGGGAQETSFSLGGIDASQELLAFNWTAGDTMALTGTDYAISANAPSATRGDWNVVLGRSRNSTTTAEVWANGVKNGADLAWSGPLDPIQQIVIGSRLTLAREWHGYIACIIVWKKWLNDPQVYSIMADPFQIFRRPMPYHLWSATAVADTITKIVGRGGLAGGHRLAGDGGGVAA